VRPYILWAPFSNSAGAAAKRRPASTDARHCEGPGNNLIRQSNSGKIRRAQFDSSWFVVAAAAVVLVAVSVVSVVVVVVFVVFAAAAWCRLDARLYLGQTQVSAGGEL
jgi:hypothetical protein